MGLNKYVNKGESGYEDTPLNASNINNDHEYLENLCTDLSADIDSLGNMSKLNYEVDSNNIIGITDSDSNKLYLTSDNIVHEEELLSDIINDNNTSISTLTTKVNKITRTTGSITLTMNVPYLIIVGLFTTEQAGYVGIALGGYDPYCVGSNNVTCSRSSTTYTFSSSLGGIYITAIQLS